MNLSQRYPTSGSTGLRTGTSLGSGGVSYFSNLGQAIAETDLRKTRPRPLTLPAIRKTKPLLSSMARLGLAAGSAAARLHPAIRFTRFAFNVANGLNDVNPWAIQQEATPGHFDPGAAGWTLCCGQPGGMYSAVQYGAIAGREPVDQQSAICSKSAENLCEIGGQVPSTSVPSYTLSDPGIPGYVRYIHMFARIGTYNPASERMRIEQSWSIRHTRGYGEPSPGPLPWPWVDEKPGKNWPLPLPAPLPPAIEENFPPYPHPNNVDPAPPPARYQNPSVTVTIDPDAGSKGPPRDDNHTRRPPYENEREKKQGMPARAVTRIIGALYDNTTEAADIVGVLYDCMQVKKPYRPGKPHGFKEKANWIYNNLDNLDIQCAMIGLVRNHYEDKYIYGKIYGTVGKHTGFGSMGPGHNGWMADFGQVTKL